MIVQDTSCGRGGGEGPIKWGYGTARPGDGKPGAVTGGRGAHNGRPEARRPRGPATGPARDAAARIPAAPAQHDRPWTRPRSSTSTAGPTSARWPHARTSPLFPIACLAAPRLTLAAQDCGGYTAILGVGCCRSGNSLSVVSLRKSAGWVQFSTLVSST